MTEQIPSLNLDRHLRRLAVEGFHGDDRGALFQRPDHALLVHAGDFGLGGLPGQRRGGLLGQRGLQ